MIKQAAKSPVVPEQESRRHALLADVVRQGDVQFADVEAISQLAELGSGADGLDDEGGALERLAAVRASAPGLALTPSMSSVMSQIRKFNNAPTSISSGSLGSGSAAPSRKRRDTSFSSTSSSSASRRRRRSNGPPLLGEPRLRDDALWFTSAEEGDNGDEDVEEVRSDASFGHPLTEIGDENSQAPGCGGLESTVYNLGLPHVKCVNPQDLDLQDVWSAADIVQLYPPVYQRRTRRQPVAPFRRASVELTIDEMRNVGMMMEPHSSGTRTRPILDTIELEHWASGDNDATQITKIIDKEENWLEMHLPNRRTRQSSLNPNFLRLYALELSCKLKSLLPDLNVDEHVLTKLSYEEIWNLNIPHKHENVSPYQIKLALITRRKLWTDMCNILRQDLHGVNAPWNLKFVSGHASEDDSGPGCTPSTSLVRVESDVKPWYKGGKDFMLRPCGKLAVGKHCKREIQYVVKGWCDSRFS
ncbi:AGR056Cp [Eremothecium gossypii ATCC 10895]|uniref:AGR056Cp n=1 Tax=Eremothecium gossypii (strain ATCC 10895 / CBS 109.51 / FGSC 9923 / NRRL Y-1056) TaxID=284811 RepID=Q750A1_EREGS|nr:AGR056Cp [Eremothecium gossypii ATCC 10895]AAS54545.2 AGR056Cp [Eremothecium gossypii ATCC 10895]AEY98877.1 FAGR056Cp [Eremothecium gossypii FDAG1]